MTALYFQTWGLTPFGGLAMGALAEGIGLQPAFLVMGVATIVVTLWIYAVTPLKQA